MEYRHALTTQCNSDVTAVLLNYWCVYNQEKLHSWYVNMMNMYVVIIARIVAPLDSQCIVGTKWHSGCVSWTCILLFTSLAWASLALLAMQYGLTALKIFKMIWIKIPLVGNMNDISL